MTGNQIKGKGFRGALRYNLAKVEKNVAEVLDSTFARSGEQAIMKEVQMIRSMRPRLEKYFYHTSINFPPDENLSSDTMKRIGHDYLHASGFNAHQFIMFRHFDAGHPHLHILVNRIGYDGKVLSDSNDFKRSEDILRALEIKYNLTRVAPSRDAKQKAVTKNELEMMKRTGEPSRKATLQLLVKQALKSRPTTEDFITTLRNNGVNVLFNQASTGYVSGITYELKGFQITGAKLGSDYKWPSVRSTLDYDQARDHRMIEAANAYARSAFGSSAPPPRTRSAKGNHTLYREEDPKADLSLDTRSVVLSPLIIPDDTGDQSTHLLGNFKKRKRKRKRR